MCKFSGEFWRQNCCEYTAAILGFADFLCVWLKTHSYALCMYVLVNVGHID